ncbi:hypothetical protein [Brevibacillus fulvus]|uniref:Spore coat protein n=1 Tax=Brevibacillus fulvus TaxID=1125967 RepID=A0A938XXD0_9BACL|nr:hypothetical protein [Brevibacillus fulvus]MBM7589430.1 hypothetical protein [Brevibacillus fulvus]
MGYQYPGLGYDQGYMPPYGPGVSGYQRHVYPPIHVPPAKAFPPDPYIDQFPLPEALQTGTLFRWLYDPYGK